MTGSRRSLRWVVLVLMLAGVVTAGVFAVLHFTRTDTPTAGEEPLTPDPPPPDPRLTYLTPFRNVKPDVKYVGDAACEGCHRAECKSYHAHPMGRSADLMTADPPHEKFPAEGSATFTAGPFGFEVEKRPEGMIHRLKMLDEPTAGPGKAEMPVKVAIGSGTRGRSYLSYEGGQVWQSPISWFGPDEKWDVSPGYRLARTLRRPIGGPCLYCHVDHVEPVAGTQNAYQEPLFPRQVAISCERCHGPGELHVAERNEIRSPPTPDTSIVNPKHLSRELQLSICEQCHLQGQERVIRRGRDLFEYRPGLPFDQFVSVFVLHPELAKSNKSVGQFEQMEQSRCFQKSGHLTCTSCHDPHFAPQAEERDTFFNGKCQTCHAPTNGVECSAPPPKRQANGDNCITCHMPKAASSNITHASVTNHRVPRVPTEPTTGRSLPFGTLPLYRFRPGTELPPEEIERDMGIALARYARLVPQNDLATRGDPRSAAVALLKSALGRWPGDAEAWEAMATARTGQGEEAERLKAAKNAYQLDPESEVVVAGLSEAALIAGEFELAIEMADKWVTLNPGSADPLTARGFVRLKQNDWVGAEADFRAALKLHPFHAEAHLYLAICRHQLGDPDEGVKIVQTAAELETDPREKAALMDWYRRATR